MRLPVTTRITGGEVSDYKGDDFVRANIRPGPKVLIADKGYDVDWIRENTEGTGASGRHTFKALEQIANPNRRPHLCFWKPGSGCFDKQQNLRLLANR